MSARQHPSPLPLDVTEDHAPGDPGRTVRVRVAAAAAGERGKPRVYGYVWADAGAAVDDLQDGLTCWAWEQGWLLSTVFRDTGVAPGVDVPAGPGLSALLQAVRRTGAHGVVLPGADDRRARAVARVISRAGVRVLRVGTPRGWS